MNNQVSSPFHIPEFASNRYQPWLTQGYTGWIDVSLLALLDVEQAQNPERLSRVPAAEAVRDRRNLTSRVEIGGRPLWIKRFRPAHLLDWPIYAAKPGKAVYAWNAAMALTSHGFRTPRPLVGLRATGYAGGANGIVAFEEIAGHELLQRMLAGDSLQPAERDELVNDLGRCLQRFHDLGFRHRDLRQGNILVGRSGDSYSFCFLDLNRLRVQPPLTQLQRLREVEKLNLPADVQEPFFRGYMPDRSSRDMAEAYRTRVAYADKLEHLPLGKLLRKTWYYIWELRAFSRSRRP